MSDIFKDFPQIKIYSYEEVSHDYDMADVTMLNDESENTYCKNEKSINISKVPCDSNKSSSGAGKKRIDIKEAENRMRKVRDTIFYISEWNGTTKPCELTCGRCGYTITIKNGNNLWSLNSDYFKFPVCDVCYKESVKVRNIFLNILKERNLNSVIASVLQKLNNKEISLGVEYPCKSFVLSFLSTYNYESFENTVLDTMFNYSKVKSNPNKYILHSFKSDFYITLKSIDRRYVKDCLHEMSIDFDYLLNCTHDEFSKIAHTEINKCLYSDRVILFDNFPHSLNIYGSPSNSE